MGIVVVGYRELAQEFMASPESLGRGVGMLRLVGAKQPLDPSSVFGTVLPPMLFHGYGIVNHGVVPATVALPSHGR